MIPALIGLVAVSALVGTVTGMLHLTALLADVFRLEHFSIFYADIADEFSARMAGGPRHEAIFDGFAGAGSGGV